MRHPSLPLCSGTVVIHRDDAATCTSDACRRDLRRGVWFSIHSRFVHCPEAVKGDGRCPDCGFGSPVIAQLAQSQLPRFAGHLRRRRGNRETDPTRSRVRPGSSLGVDMQGSPTARGRARDQEVE